MKSVARLVQKNPLYFAALPFSVVDGVLTLVGQAPQYFRSGQGVNEASPAFFFLQASPWIFFGGSLLWWILWYLLFKKSSLKIQLFWCLLFIAGHAWGSSTWIVKFFRDAGMWTVENQFVTMTTWSVLIGYFAVIAAWAAWCFSIRFRESATE